MNKIIIHNAVIVNEGKQFKGGVIIRDNIIHRVFEGDTPEGIQGSAINAQGGFLIPGMIDDQVHFREPGLTHKADIYTESRAAAAGGITSFMEMPNTIPNTTTIELLEEKYRIAEEKSAVNYSFFMGATNNNISEIQKINPKNVCGVKIFMGSSTGNMLVDNKKALEAIFSESPTLIATHCEDEQTIRNNLAKFQAHYGDNIPVQYHPIIRSREACYKSSSFAVELAEKTGARLHILHISTKEELSLFDNKQPLSDKKITAEACVHHLWFTDKDYERKGTLIKWNPAVKTSEDRKAIQQAVAENKIDVIATDHAPHTIEEKQQPYTKAPSGGPLVQHALPALMELYQQGVFSVEKIVEKTAHAPAVLFNIHKRGFIREGYFADLVIIQPNPWTVSSDNILYKCRWSPFEGQTFSYQVSHTFVNGKIVYENGKINDSVRGERLLFDR